MDLSVNFSLDNGQIFEKQTAKEFFLIYLAYSVKIIAVQLQFIDTEEALQKKSAGLSMCILLTKSPS